MRQSVLFVLGVLVGCAGLRGDSAADQWQSDAKAQAREKTPEMEQDMVRSMQQQNGRITPMREQVEASTTALGDILLGNAPMPGLSAAKFEDQTRLVTKHVSFPVLLPFEQRQLNKFFAPMSAADTQRLKKLASKRELMQKVTEGIKGVQSAGYMILLEQNRAMTLNWSAELMAFYLGSKAIAFERMTESKVGDDTLDAIAAALSNRDQSRALLVTHTGTLAAFEGVSQGGDPKAITTLAEAMKAQTSAESQTSREAARVFLDGIQGEALDVAASLEAGMREAVGDKSYENAYQAGLVQTLQQIEDAQAEASIYEQIDEQAKQAKRQEAQQLRRSAKERLVARAKELGLEKATGFIGALPGGKQLLAGLRAIKELRAGNPRGALEAALEAAPPGPIGTGLQTASKLAFAVADAAKRRRR